jgi:hypothetical protein
MKYDLYFIRDISRISSFKSQRRISEFDDVLDRTFPS